MLVSLQLCAFWRHDLLEDALKLGAGIVGTEFLRLLHKPPELRGINLLQSLDSDLPMSRLIGETPTDDTTKGTLSASLIFDSDCAPMAISEIKLGKVAVKMLFPAVLIDALHAALEDAEKALDGIGVNWAKTIFTAIVAHNVVLREVVNEVAIVPCLIGHDPRLGGNMLAENGHHGRGLQVVYDHAARTTSIAVNKAQDFVFMSIAAPSQIAPGLHRIVATYEGLIDLDNAAAGTERHMIASTHRLTYTMVDEPSGFQGHTEGTVQLVRANPLLAGADQEDRLQPDMKLDVAGLEDGPDFDGEWLAADIALVGAYAGALALQLADAFKGAAVRAYALFGPDPSLDKFICCFFVVEVGFREYGHGFDPFRVPIR